MIKTIKRLYQWISQSLSSLWDKPYSVMYVEDPVDNPKNKVLYIIGIMDEPWQVEILCPCGCKEKIVLPVNYETSPRWSIELKSDGLPTLHPSIWRSKGCKSHFFLKFGKIMWIE